MSIVESIDLFHINFALASMKEGRKKGRKKKKKRRRWWWRRRKKWGNIGITIEFIELSILMDPPPQWFD